MASFIKFKKIKINEITRAKPQANSKLRKPSANADTGMHKEKNNNDFKNYTTTVPLNLNTRTSHTPFHILSLTTLLGQYNLVYLLSRMPGIQVDMLVKVKTT